MYIPPGRTIHRPPPPPRKPPSTLRADEMKMRDAFAKAAMEAFIAGHGINGTIAVDDQHVAERAYEMADAMMAARLAR